VHTKSVDLRLVSDEDDGLSWRNKQISLDDVTLAEAARMMGGV
jgi:transmembrane sensor